MSETNLLKFKKLLAELFMFDQADLDFGIYRIMNAKRDEITRFLDNDLLPQVRSTLASVGDADRAALEEDLGRAIEQTKALGADPDTIPKVKELRQQLAAKVDLDKLENEVFSNLFDFFRRYYSEGDFLSLRRYKPGVYSIPYEGEEVKLHWANADQYYIKTSEYFRDYTFKLADSRRVHFKIASADTEKDNVKASAEKDRRFLLVEADPVIEEHGELVIRFEYRPDEQRRKQAAINEATVTAVLVAAPQAWQGGLATASPTESNPQRTIFEKHLKEYTARNTFDYFIHKDLGGFLKRELDFYIKNEIVHLDDIENATAPRGEQYLNKVKAIRAIAHKIIDFVAQMEDFQKRLWLKKKFVVDVNYCITLDRVPEELYSEIASNEAQRSEWVTLFHIDDVTPELGAPVFSTPLPVEFLKAHQQLVLDTQYYSQDFKARLLQSIPELDDSIDGLLIQSDNHQAIRLLSARYAGRIQCLYLDPPYNTAASEILYKNEYRHSSWLSLMENRLREATAFLNDDSIVCIAIDDAEYPGLIRLMEHLYGEHNHLATVVVRSNPHGRAMAARFSQNHEYAVFFAKSSQAVVGRLPRDDRRQARYSGRDEEGNFTWINFRKTGVDSRRQDRPKSFFPVYVQNNSVRIPELKWADDRDAWVTLEEPLSTEVVVWPLDEEGNERVWSLGLDRAQVDAETELESRNVDGQFQVYRKYRPNEDGTLPGTWWEDAKYSATESGTRIIKQLFGDRENFSYPKSVYLTEDCLRSANCLPNSTILDVFAGSGTTGHAVINMNRIDAGRRKFVLVEMGLHFDTVLLPRIKKCIYASDWDAGKPLSHGTGISQCCRVIRLEGYEDSLANLIVSTATKQTSLLTSQASLREDFYLRYMLGVQTAGSPSLLNADRFEDPFSYKLKIAKGSVGETQEVDVDLTETFNFLIGLRVKHIDTIKGINIVQGTNPAGEKVLIIWRNVKETPNAALDEFFLKQKYNTRDMEFDLIYVNGDNNLENLRRPDDSWKVRLIEEEFLRLMFDKEEA